MLQADQTIDYTMLEPGTRKRKRVSSEPRTSGTTLDAHILEPEDLATDDAEIAPSTAPQAPGADPPSSSTTVPVAPVPPSTTAARGVSTEGMRVLWAADAKVNWLVERLPNFVKEAIEAPMAPYTQAITDIRKEQDKIKEHVRHIDRRLEQIEGGSTGGLPAIRADLAKVKEDIRVLKVPDIELSAPILPSGASLFSTGPTAPAMPSGKGVEEPTGEEEETEEEEEEEEEESEKEFDEELEVDLAVEEARTSARAAGIAEDEIDTYVAMQQSLEASRKSRGASRPPREGEASSSTAPPVDTRLPPSVGPEILTPRLEDDTAPLPLIVPPLEVLPADQTPSDA
ncbi:uncharacterized protein LOC132624369 [Lycium barbarum]|uniref:uncharacterized protein LOC132624369 n=1 Tax=Lycium barbarum TaxID=112863 RepID=UPI00293F357D|nr:uncharacterized protein LOC132624369 [Lycium barbarum]